MQDVVESNPDPKTGARDNQSGKGEQSGWTPETEFAARAPADLAQASVGPLLRSIESQMALRFSTIDAKLDQIFAMQCEVQGRRFNRGPFFGDVDDRLCCQDGSPILPSVQEPYCKPTNVPFHSGGAVKESVQEEQPGGNEVTEEVEVLVSPTDWIFYQSDSPSEDDSQGATLTWKDAAEVFHDSERQATDEGSYLPSVRKELSVGARSNRSEVSSAGYVRSGSDGSREELMARNRCHHLEKVWPFLDDPESSRAAILYDRIRCAFILVSVISALLQTIVEWGPERVIEIIVEAVFLVELLVRLIACPHCGLLFTRYNLVDLVSSAPMILRIYLFHAMLQDGSEALHTEAIDRGWLHTRLLKVLLGIVPILRLLKFIRRFEQMHLLARAFGTALEALPVIVFSYIVLMLSFSGLLLIFDEESNEYPNVLWLAIVSMTTLGYGDVIPKTSAAKVVTGAFVFTTVLYTAIPLGIIGNAFNDVWRDRDRLLLMRRTRLRFRQAGYSPRDLPRLFKVFDINKDGEIDIHEFSLMLDAMEVRLPPGKMVQLYGYIKSGNKGGIESDDFIRALFPEQYVQAFTGCQPADQESPEPWSPTTWHSETSAGQSPYSSESKKVAKMRTRLGID